jgi:tetratricopeptide (TPR) repeat protein
MEDAGVEPRTIVQLLPRTTEIVIAVRDSFDRVDELPEWLSLVEDLLPKTSNSLLIPYAEGCLAVNAPDRLLLHVSALGVRADQKEEAERQIALGRAFVRKKDWSRAAKAAHEGSRLAAGDPRLLELVGLVALDAGDASLAVTSFRDALGALALAIGRAPDRARLYRRRGEALERLGRVEDAINDYRRAIEILPDDPWLRQRFNSFGAGARPHSGR